MASAKSGSAPAGKSRRASTASSHANRSEASRGTTKKSLNNSEKYDRRPPSGGSESATGRYINSVLQVRSTLGDKDIHSLGRYRRRKNNAESAFITKLLILVCKAVGLVLPDAEKPWTDSSDFCQSTPYEVLDRIIAADPSKPLPFKYSSVSTLLPPPPAALPARHPTRVLYTWLTTYCEYNKQLVGAVGSVRGSDVDPSDCQESIATTATEARLDVLEPDHSSRNHTMNNTVSSHDEVSISPDTIFDTPPSPLTAEMLRRKEEAEQRHQDAEMEDLLLEQRAALHELHRQEREVCELDEVMRREGIDAGHREGFSDLIKTALNSARGATRSEAARLEQERQQVEAVRRDQQRDEARRQAEEVERRAQAERLQRQQRQEEAEAAQARAERDQRLRQEEDRAVRLRENAEHALAEQQRELEGLRQARVQLEAELRDQKQRQPAREEAAAAAAAGEEVHRRLDRLKEEEGKLSAAQNATLQMQREAQQQREELARLVDELHRNRTADLEVQRLDAQLREAERERVEGELESLRVRQQQDALRVEQLETRVDHILLHPLPSPSPQALPPPPSPLVAPTPPPEAQRTPRHPSAHHPPTLGAVERTTPLAPEAPVPRTPSYDMLDPADEEDATWTDTEVRMQALCALAWQQYHCIAACCTFLNRQLPEVVHSAILFQAMADAERFGSFDGQAAPPQPAQPLSASSVGTLSVPRLQGVSECPSSGASRWSDRPQQQQLSPSDELVLRQALAKQHQELLSLAAECEENGMPSSADPALTAVIHSGSLSLSGYC